MTITHSNIVAIDLRFVDMDRAIDLSDPSAALNLSNIRIELIRLEDIIIFNLIERVQFPYNGAIYDPAALPIPNSNLALAANLSLADYMLSETERLHSLVRRYDAPDEYPYFPQVLQRPLLKPLKYPKILHPNTVNVNPTIKDQYVNVILPAACQDFNRAPRGEDKENYGSAATADIACLQALSRRIHFGKFVAEAKFLKETDRFVQLIKNGDTAGIDAAITDAAVEQQVLNRLRLKAKTYGTDPSKPNVTDARINVDAVVDMYAQVVIPLTKVVEVDYLMQRLKGTEWE